MLSYWLPAAYSKAMKTSAAPTIDAPMTGAVDLAEAGLIANAEVSAADAVAARYAIRVTPEMAALMDGPDGAQIRRQFIPDPAELETAPGELLDPIGDDAHSPVPGVVHRYPDRVLLKPISVCPVYCRFCFRRETVGAAPAMAPDALEAAYAYIASRPEIWEVILTGGDPLMLKPNVLARVIQKLTAIPHVQILRIHTRVPIADPGRVSKDLIAAIKTGGRLTPYVSIHCNHPAELTDASRAAAAQLADAGIPLIGQTVLLKGVNNDVAILERLMRGLVAARIQPYYLHHPDLAPGTARFRLDIAEGQALAAALRGKVSGLCQPTYVLDTPGGFGKAPLAGSHAEKRAEGWRIRDPFGRDHGYPPQSRLSRSGLPTPDGD